MLISQDLPIVTRLLSEGSIVVSLRTTDKTSTLNALLDVASENKLVADASGARKAVFEREAQMSTGVGSGLAIPHARTDAVTGTVAVMGILAEPISYDSLDGEPVRLVLLLLGPRNDATRHIRILSRVSRLMSDQSTRMRLLQAADEQEALELFALMESALIAD